MRRRAVLAGSLVTAMMGASARAQNYPSKPIRWIIPFAAAGNYDLTSRLVGEAMGRRLGQTVISPHKVRFPCPACGLQRHDADAVHCKACGTLLNIPNDEA